jgi:hypothetical protein
MYTYNNTYESIIDNMTLNNRLFCTFVEKEHLEKYINQINSQYTLLNNKIFVLDIKESNEYACTYNIEQDNVSQIIEGTILVHRKKESNTLYTLNALNELIRKLNGGIVDPTFPINWKHYRNCILLTKEGQFKQLSTRIEKIVEF